MNFLTGQSRPSGAVIEEYANNGVMMIGWEEPNQLGEKSAQMPLHPPRISRQVTWD
jgi:hypothetical protein